MALKYLSIGEMVGITGSWVDPSHNDRQALASVEAVIGLLSLLDQVHEGLLVNHELDPQAEHNAALTQQSQLLDVEHDSFTRVTSSILQGHINLAIANRRDDEAKALTHLHDKLLPDGLRIVNYSYREEGGQAQLLESRLDDDDKAVLASIPTRDGTLLDAVLAWIDAGKRLGQLENQRMRLTGTSTPAGRRLYARNRWIRAVSSLRGVLELTETDQPTVLDMLALLDRVERAATARARTGQPASDTDASDTDSSGTGSSGTDASGTDTSGTGSSGTDTSGTGSSGTDTSGTDSSGTDTSGTDSSSTDTSGTDSSGTDANDCSPPVTTSEVDTLELDAVTG